MNQQHSETEEEVKARIRAESNFAYPIDDTYSSSDVVDAIVRRQAHVDAAIPRELENARLRAELTQLRRWKAEALEVMPDFQALAKELNLPLGSMVTPHLLPAIQRLNAELTALREKTVEIAGDAWDAHGQAIWTAGISHDNPAKGTGKARTAHLDALRRKINSSSNKG